MLFGVPKAEDKDPPQGSGASDPDGILNVGLRALADELGDSTVIMQIPASTSSPITATAAC